jgi:hypothetical protein
MSIDPRSPRRELAVRSRCRLEQPRLVCFVKGLKSCSIAASAEDVQEWPILGCSRGRAPTTIADAKDHRSC